MKKYNLLILIIILFAILFIFSIFIETNYEQDTIKDLLSSATFLFGIFTAFSITNAHSRINTVNDIFANEDSRLLVIYNYSKSFPSKVQKKILTLIDQYLIDQIDFKKHDFYHSYPSFVNLMQYCLSIPTHNFHEEEAYEQITCALTNSLEDRKKIETLVRQKLTSIEWTVILALLGMIGLFMFFLNNGTLLYLSAALLMLLILSIFTLVIWNLDNMLWNDTLWTWRALEELFISMGLLPYFPKVIIDAGRAKPQKNQKIRLATYPYSYPNLQDKQIEIVTWK